MKTYWFVSFSIMREECFRYTFSNAKTATKFYKKLVKDKSKAGLGSYWASMGPVHQIKSRVTI